MRYRIIPDFGAKGVATDPVNAQILKHGPPLAPPRRGRRELASYEVAGIHGPTRIMSRRDVGIAGTHTLASFVQDIKQTSSHWIHETLGVEAFAWPQGYGAFTVSASMRDEVKGYIAGQAEHHRLRTFQKEYVTFLRKHDVEQDERYVW